MKLGVVAKPENYIKSTQGRYVLCGKDFLALPGAITSEPSLGARIYNDNLEKYLLSKKPRLGQRSDALFVRFYQNRRVRKINSLNMNSAPIDLSDLTNIEKVLFFASNA